MMGDFQEIATPFAISMTALPELQTPVELTN